VLQSNETVTLELSISAAFQEKMQQLAAIHVGAGKQTRLEVQVKVLEGRLHNMQLVKDSPYNTTKLISLDDTPEGESHIYHPTLPITPPFARREAIDQRAALTDAFPSVLSVAILCLDRVNSDMFAPRKWYVTVSYSHTLTLSTSHSLPPPTPTDASFACSLPQLLSSIAGCKLTVSGRIVTLTTSITADKQRLVTEHLHSPALLHYGLDEQHQQNMASVALSSAVAPPSDAAPASDAPYHAMDEKEPANKV
jgi:hypothetical protein